MSPDLILGDGEVGSAQPAPYVTRALERVILDPLSEDSANIPLEITGRFAGHSIFLVSHAYPPATREQVRAQGFDVEGARVAARGKRGTREIPVKVWVAEATGIGAGTNLHANPKAGRDATGYTNSGGVSMARELLGATTPYPADCPAETAMRWSGNGDGDHFYYSLAVTTGQPYVLSCWIRLASLTADDVVLEVRNASGTVKATGSAIETVGEWRRYFLAFTPDATATWRMAVRQRGAGTVDLALTAEQIEAGTALTDYFDGDTPGCDWTGTSHASTSTRLAAGGADLFQGALNDLEAKITKLADYAGTLKRILPNGDAYVFDVIDASMGDEWERHFSQGRIAVPLTFVCQPLARQAEQSFTATDETGQPVLRNTVGPIPGTAPAKVRLEVTDLEGTDRAAVGFCLQMEHYDSAASADLFYEAEGRTPLNGAATATLSSLGASGGGSNVVRQPNLGGTWAAVLSTQSSGGSHLTHVGTYKVRAKIHRPPTNSGAVSVALSWGVGDLRSFRRNDPVTFKANDREGVLTIVDLGIVRIPQIVKGTQRWEGRVLAKSTVATDDLDVDCIWLEDVTEAQGVARSEFAPDDPTAFSAADEYEQASGALTGKTLRTGGTWTAPGAGTDATDFAVVSTSSPPRHDVERTASADADLDTGRYLYASTPTLGTVTVAVDVRTDSLAIGSRYCGVLARFGDASNWLMAVVDFSNDAKIMVRKRLGGTVTEIDEADVSVGADTWYRIVLTALAGGGWAVRFGAVNAALGEPIISGYDADLASGGALSSGKVGIYDATTIGASPPPGTRRFDNFAAWIPPTDAALFASQSLEFRSDGYFREDAAGGIYVPVSDPDGDYPLAPPSGREGRTLRYLVWAARNDPASMGETTLDDLRAQLHVTPRFDVVPKPS